MAAHGVINTRANDHCAYGTAGRVVVMVGGGQWVLN